MFLKRIELQGFKSFADKTQIEFQSGITGVVGPNGSGKSNISDAIRWVLGEQSVKSLRGSKMEDVVFAGTDKRKQLGFAEVTLVLDNSEKDLPIEYSEVSVTRRVFRSGESEYYINKNSCRLKDIKELFMDTGVGKDGYSIIGQGRIDEILSPKSEGRRNIFEEAAGIVKYKSRKEEAEKKLNKTEENLIRINDIVDELEKQIGPLEEQSRTAVEYKSLSEELKKLQINIYIDEIMSIRETLSQIELEKKQALENLQQKQAHKIVLDSNYNSIKQGLEKKNLDIDAIKNSEYDTKNNVEKKKSELSLTTEKISYFEKERNRYSEEASELRDYIEESKTQEQEFQKKKAQLEEKLDALRQDKSKRDIDFKEIKDQIDQKEKYIEEKKGSIIETFNIIADKKNKMNSLNSFKENIEKRLNQIVDEISEISNLREQTNKNIEFLEENISYDKGLLISATDKLRDLIDNKNNRAIKLQEINIKLNNTKANIQGKKSKHKLLCDMSKEYEGYYKGVKNALKACDRDKELGQGVKGVLAELIVTPKEYEKAVEIALGSAIQNIVIDNQENAKRVINHLKANNLGRVTFLPLSSISGRYLNPNEKRLLDESGVIGVGSELLGYDIEYKNIMESLLGRVLFVKRIEDGIEISKKCNYSLKIVSLDGDVLNPGGSMTGGSLNNYNTKLLGRQREIDELIVEIEELNEEHSSFLSQKEILEREIEFLELDILSNNETINATKLSLATQENKYAQSCEEDQKNKSLIDKFLFEQESLMNERVSIGKDTENIELELTELHIKNDKTQSSIEKYLAEFEEEKIKKEDMDKEITDLKIARVSLEQENKSIVDTIERLKREVEKSLYSIDKKQEAKDIVTKNIEALNEEIKLTIDEKATLESSLENYKVKLDEINKSKSDMIKSFEDEENKLKQINIEIMATEKAINSLELKFERNNIQYENYNNKLWEEYELSLQMALEYKEHIEDIKKTQSEVKNIKAKIKTLGNINLNAIDEYKNVKERYEFMTEQIDDLTEAKDSLDSVIKDMYLKMKEQFVESFEIIRTNFITVFEELFGGGKADVFLTDESDVLCSGIEIVAQPPGKKLQSLLLLSGGERALTAIALLFAIIKTKPTPFCVLDEIEAALDESNVYRYAQYLKEFSSTTQFIAITHRKGTMENVDSLYGVTMEEEGISKLVSIKLSEKEKVS